MKTPVLLAAILALSSSPLGAERPLVLAVSPVIAFEPSYLRVRASVASSDDNRFIEIIAESDVYYRSSEIQLDGNRAPRTTLVEFRDLPAGTYSVSAIVKGTAGKALASSFTEIRVISRSASEP